MNTNYSGNYLTFIQQPDATWTGGPVFVINTNSKTLVIDGISMKNPTFTNTSVSWIASSGNPSSGSLTFYASGGSNGFVGKYVVGSGSLPSSNNISGISSAAPDDLSVWNGTYNTFIKNGSKWTKDSKLTISAPNVSYKGKDISGYIYQGSSKGASNLDQLSWFTSSGNDENVIIEFSKDKSGYLTFFGDSWASGEQPSEGNFSGTTKDTPEPPTITAIIALVISSTESTEASEVSETSETSEVSETSDVSEVSEAEVSEVSEVEVSEVEVAEVEVAEVEVAEIEIVIATPHEKPNGKTDTVSKTNSAEEDKAAAADLKKKTSGK